MSDYPWDASKPFDPSQHPAATEMGRDICVSAGAGCGKTSLLVARVLNLVETAGIPLERILAITFTDKAANEMKRRIRETLGSRLNWQNLPDVENAPISTIHGFCARLLRENAFPASVDPDFLVLDEHQAELLLLSAMDEALDEAFSGEARGEMFRLTMALGEEKEFRKALRAAYEKSRSLGLPPGRLAPLGAAETSRPASSEKRSPGLELRLGEYHHSLAQRFIWLLERLDECYRTRKEALSALDFEDLQLRTRELLEDSGIRQECRRRFQQVLVDEFQDVNPLEDEIIGRVAGKGRLFIVGDVKQSIYRFRHAEVALFLRRMEEAGKRDDAWRMALGLNFRSRRAILEFVNEVFSYAWAGGAFRHEELHFGAPFPDSSEETRVQVLLLPNREDVDSLEQARQMEAAFLARMIRETVEGQRLQVYDSQVASLRSLRYGDIFMLFRSTRDTDIYERALAREGVPYYSASSRGFFERSEVRDTIAFLKTIDNPYDDLALAGVLRSPWVGVADATLVRVAAAARGAPLFLGLGASAEDPSLPGEEQARLADFLEYLREVIGVRNRLVPGNLLRKVVRDNGFEAKVLAQPNGNRGLANLRKFCRLVDELDPTTPSLGELLRHIEDISVAPVREGEAPLEPEAADVLTLMTWHAAKGLEKEMVILADLSHRRPTGMPRALVDQTGHLGLKLTFPRVAESGKAAAETWDPVEEQRETERQAESEEEKRMLYVAMTRAQEYLVLSGLRPEDMETCGVRLAQVIADARPGLVRVEQIPAAADTSQVPLEGTDNAQEDGARGEEEANRR